MATLAASSSKAGYDEPAPAADITASMPGRPATEYLNPSVPYRRVRPRKVGLDVVGSNELDQKESGFRVLLFGMSGDFCPGLQDDFRVEITFVPVTLSATPFLYVRPQWSYR